MAQAQVLICEYRAVDITELSDLEISDELSKVAADGFTFAAWMGTSVLMSRPVAVRHVELKEPGITILPGLPMPGATGRPPFGLV